MTKRQRSAPAIRRTAVHEAGHAVLATIVRLDCTQISVIPRVDDLSDGYCIYRVDPLGILTHWENCGVFHMGERSALLASSIVLLAGGAAERTIFGRAGNGSYDDIRRAKWMVDDMTSRDGDVRITLARLQRTVGWLVTRHKLAIEYVSAALVTSGELEGDRLAATMSIALVGSYRASESFAIGGGGEFTNGRRAGRAAPAAARQAMTDTMTRPEVVAYLGYLNELDILAHMQSGELPKPVEGDLRDLATARWDKGAVDRALDRASSR